MTTPLRLCITTLTFLTIRFPFNRDDSTHYAPMRSHDRLPSTSPSPLATDPTAAACTGRANDPPSRLPGTRGRTDAYRIHFHLEAATCFNEPCRSTSKPNSVSLSTGRRRHWSSRGDLAWAPKHSRSPFKSPAPYIMESHSPIRYDPRLRWHRIRMTDGALLLVCHSENRKPSRACERNHPYPFPSAPVPLPWSA